MRSGNSLSRLIFAVGVTFLCIAFVLALLCIWSATGTRQAQYGETASLLGVVGFFLAFFGGLWTFS